MTRLLERFADREKFLCLPGSLPLSDIVGADLNFGCNSTMRMTLLFMIGCGRLLPGRFFVQLILRGLTSTTGAGLLLFPR